MRVVYRPIGTIHSPFRGVEGVPIQPTAAAGIRGSVEILPELAEGLQDVDGFSHVVPLYHFHLVRESRLTVTPFLDSRPHGVFATRAPARPNTIRLSIVKPLGVEGNVLHVENVGIVDGTPLLDIEPYAPESDHHAAQHIGWLEQARGQAQAQKADGCFR